MPAKRKLPKTESPHSSPYSKRIRKGRQVQVDHTEVAEKILDVIKNHRSSDLDGHAIFDTLFKVPSKRQNPEYYEVIKEPIDLHRIHQRLRLEEYKNIDSLTADIELLVGNTKKYYKEDTVEVEDANSLWELYLDTKAGLMPDFIDNPVVSDTDEKDDSNTESTTPSVSLQDMMQELYHAMITALSDDGRQISAMFMSLPDKQIFPEYYTAIKDPIDLTTIHSRMERENYYLSMHDFEKDVNLLTKNAETFNEPDSQIYSDALAINRIFYSKLEELESTNKSSGKTSARIRRKRKSVPNIEDMQSFLDSPIRTSRKNSPVPASLVNCAEDNYIGLFFNEVVNCRGMMGNVLSTQFMRLPNRHHYPRYYELVENPISCKKIRQNVLTHKYNTVSDVASDFSRWLNNAMLFEAEHEPQAYTDAKDLLEFMSERTAHFVKLEEEHEDSVDEEEEESGTEQEESDNSQEETDESSIIKKRARKSTEKRKSVRKKSSSSLSIDIFRERLRLYYELMLNAETDDGRLMITLFMEKPSRKDYPDYYKLILEPIDMRTIDRKIRTDKYNSLEMLLDDFNLMFNNARHYNETGSEVYQDADALQKTLFTKHNELGDLPPISGDKRSNQTAKKNEGNPLLQLMEAIFQRVRDYKDPANRYICQLFNTLPSKQELPDYYQVIKKPMDMDRIMQKIQSNYYQSGDEFMNDLFLMFENGCTYNEPGSVIYKDALILQKFACECYNELREDSTPQVHKQVHSLLLNLFQSIMKHHDENMRCYSESLSMSAVDPIAPKPINEQLEPGEIRMDTSQQELQTVVPQPLITLDAIRANLYKGKYRRLDVFQEHVFDLFEAVRGCNRTDSEAYEDVVELQRHFIDTRDKLCRNGETMMSPALAYTQRHLHNDLEEEKKEKLPLEQQEDEAELASSRAFEVTDGDNTSQEMDYEGTKYEPGDFVYVENLESKEGATHIVCIEKLYTDNNQQRVYGNWFYRPAETFHLPSRRFLEKEVFKSDYYNTVPVNKIKGKCYVMLNKEYFKMTPAGFTYDHTYICRNRYSSKSKAFKPLKIFKRVNTKTVLEPRDAPIVPVYVASVFVQDKLDDESSASDVLGDWWPEELVKKDREDIEVDGRAPDGMASFIQLCLQDKTIKLGDSFYLKSNEGTNFKPKMIRVEAILRDKLTNVWLQGSYFVGTDQTKHEPSRMFYRNEVFQFVPPSVGAEGQVVNIAPIPWSWLGDRCCVLPLNDAVQCRPTELREKDIFICQARYFDADSSIVKKKWCFKMFSLSNAMIGDEMFYVGKSIELVKEVSPLLLAIVTEEEKLRLHEATMETKPDIKPDPIAIQQQQQHAFIPPQTHMPHEVQYQNINGQLVPYQPQYNQQGYPIQPQQQYQYPNQQIQYQQPGQVAYAQYATIQQQPIYTTNTPSPHPAIASPHAERVATPSSTVNTPNTTKKKLRGGHSTGYILYASEAHPRVRADNPELPFGEISKIIGEEWRSQTDEKKKEYEEKARQLTKEAEAEGRYVPKKKKKKKDAAAAEAPATPQAPPIQPQMMYAGTPQGMNQAYMQRPPFQPGMPGQVRPMQPNPKMYPGGIPPNQYPPPGQPPQMQQPVVEAPPPAKKLFVPPPPKVQRVLHSEAYLRYIEGLEKGSSTLSGWKDALSATEPPKVKPENENKLPTHWLKNGKGNHENMVSALWSLRDLMMKDALTIKSALN